MATIQTVNMALERNTQIMVKHTDNKGVVHTFKVRRTGDGEYEGDKAFMDLYEFDREGKKPNFKIRFKKSGEEKGAWIAAGWGGDRDAAKGDPATPATQEEFPSDDDAFGDW